MLGAIAIFAAIALIGGHWLTTSAAPPCDVGQRVCPPSVTPPTVSPPTVAPPAVSPPTVTPPTVAPPTVAPPSATPPVSATPSTGSSRGGGLASGAYAATAPSGAALTATQLDAALLTAVDSGGFQLTDTTTSTSGVLCGVDVHTLPPAVERDYVAQAEAAFVGIAPDVSRHTLHIALASFATPAAASLFLQDAASQLGPAGQLVGDSVVMTDPAGGNVCVLGQEAALVIAVQVTGGDSQLNQQQAGYVLALQRQRIRTVLAGSDPAAVTASATPLPAPSASPTPASNPVDGSDEDPPQPSL